MRQIKKLTWLQAFILGDVRVIWCNSLRNSLFQIHVMDFVELVIDLYVHITSHVSQAFASCTHYTSYSLLNCVHVIVCFWSDQPSLSISGNWCRTCLLVWFFFGILRKNLALRNLGWIHVFLENISSHTHAFSL